MSAGTSEFFCLICLLVCSCTAQEITAERGQDVILPCKVPNINNINDITAVGWSRPDLDPEYVLLYRDGRFDPNNQHPSYQNRVDLQDEEMKDGDISLILKNVTTEDTGRYVCRVSQKGKAEPFSIINLKVYLSAQEKITAKHGQDVILPCKVPNINNITAVEWIRPDLDPDHVLLYRSKRLDPDNQHPSYQNQVDLQDEEMKDGDVSLILKNVKMEDTGTYECHVFEKGKKYLISIINLEVHLSDHSWKTKVGVGVGVPLGFFILLIPAVVFVYWKRKTLEEKIQRLKGNNSEIIDLLQQKTQENEALQDEVETLKSYTDPSSQLQLEIERNETLESHLKEWMETGRKLKTVIQNMNKELNEMNFDTNSEPTGSDEKNQQEKLEKQKLKETVGNLKTELQKMNQELELMGTKTAEVLYDHAWSDNISTEEKKSQQ